MTNKKDSHFFKVFEKIRHQLRKKIYDQDDAIDEVVDALIHISCRPEETQPRGIFTFLGPDSAGKTYLARSLATILEGYSSVIHLDMEQYSEPESILQLLGGKGVLEGAQEGELLRNVREHPRSIIVFEGIEKADNQLHLALLSLLSNGEPDSGVSFREAIVIFTSTLGSALYRNKDFLERFRKNRLQTQDLVINVISREKKVVFDMIQPAIAPKLLDGMARNFIMLFNSLNLDSMVRIGSQSLEVHAKQFVDKSGIELQFKDLEQLMSILSFHLALISIQKRLSSSCLIHFLEESPDMSGKGRCFLKKSYLKYPGRQLLS